MTRGFQRHNFTTAVRSMFIRVDVAPFKMEASVTKWLGLSSSLTAKDKVGQSSNQNGLTYTDLWAC